MPKKRAKNIIALSEALCIAKKSFNFSHVQEYHFTAFTFGLAVGLPEKEMDFIGTQLLLHMPKEDFNKAAKQVDELIRRWREQ